MMKKLFRLLLLGLFTVSISLPCAGDTAMAQDTQEDALTSSVYSEIDKPNLVTLDNGECAEFKIKATIAKEGDLEGLVLYCRINTVEAYDETFSLEISSPTCEKIAPFRRICYGERLFETRPSWDYAPEIPETHEIIFKLTNYSAGPTTYNVSYGRSIPPRPNF